jgi:hypothetical protein
MKHSDDGSPTGYSGIGSALKGLVVAQVSLGKELLNVVASGVADYALGASGKIKMPARSSSCCNIPEPCWMPVSDGTVTCELCSGATGQLWLTVTNENFVNQAYTAVAAGVDAALVVLSPHAFNLGPKERAIVSVTFTVPASPKEHYDLLIWVAGCQKHYMRWEIDSSGKNDSCCHDISVHDKPNYVVHWYDHFYCPRPCMHSGPRFTPGLGGN